VVREGGLRDFGRQGGASLLRREPVQTTGIWGEIFPLPLEKPGGGTKKRGVFGLGSLDVLGVRGGGCRFEKGTGNVVKGVWLESVGGESRILQGGKRSWGKKICKEVISKNFDKKLRGGGMKGEKGPIRGEKRSFSDREEL